MIVLAVVTFAVLAAGGTCVAAWWVGRYRAHAYPCPTCHVSVGEKCDDEYRRYLVRRRFFEMALWVAIEVGVLAGAAFAASSALR